MVSGFVRWRGTNGSEPVQALMLRFKLLESAGKHKALVSQILLSEADRLWKRRGWQQCSVSARQLFKLRVIVRELDGRRSLLGGGDHCNDLFCRVEDVGAQYHRLVPEQVCGPSLG